MQGSNGLGYTSKVMQSYNIIFKTWESLKVDES